MSFKDGQFGKLTILKEIRPDIFLCRCACGTELELWRSQLADRIYTNCRKCLPPSKWVRTTDNSAHARVYVTQSGQRKYLRTREMQSYLSMQARCYCDTNPAYETYGGRGIRVCQRWSTGGRGQGFKNFLADMGPRPSGKTLDRISPQGHYEPGNCRWADDQTQYKNQRRWIVAAGGKIGRVESITEVNLRLAKEREEFNRGLTMDREGEDLVY